MNYIGSKYSLANFLRTTIQQVVGQKLESAIFCDLFAGTGMVGRIFQDRVKKIISNDIEYYAYILNRNYIGNRTPLPNAPFSKLNALEGVEGFIFHQYAEGGRASRQYFSHYNGKKIDAIRKKIECLKNENEICQDTYFFLLASLLESADKVANTASVYAAYLKKLKKTAQKNLVLQPAQFEINDQKNEVFNQDANILIKNIEGNILYLDPPYNARQYSTNYHLLNTIALYDEFAPQGKTGLRPNYTKSKYCQKQKAEQALEELIKNANFEYIFLSYNNEGIIADTEVRAIFEKYGRYDLATQTYARFMADKAENRKIGGSKVVEYLHILEKK
ncbi:DNA adenine methylase [Hugenholtzia roseola]|uniref:DNA adenine methylase n=1 Tax=Hugenholtzia roseola TaxID=1002 RepID=UPI0003FA9320|nr:DNA adenine methylase [Hugenholtzia roseola]